MTIDNPDLMQHIASDAVLEEAYAWLCERRKDYSSNDDVWDLRRRWAEIKPHRCFGTFAETVGSAGMVSELYCKWVSFKLLELPRIPFISIKSWLYKSQVFNRVQYTRIWCNKDYRDSIEANG